MQVRPITGLFTRPAQAAAGIPGQEPTETFRAGGGESAPARPQFPRQAERERAYADLARPEPEAALPWLNSGDPHVRRLAQKKYCASLSGQLEKYVAERGPVEGAAAQLRLKSMFVGKLYQVDRTELEPALTLLDGSVRKQGRASEGALQALLQVTRNLAGRSRDFEVEPGAKEEAAQLSARAGQMLSDWWRDGLCEMPGHAPGSLPLAELAAREKLAVRGNRLERSRPPGGEAEGIIAMNQPSILVTMLAQNEKGGRELAGQLVQEVLARADEGRAIKVLSGLLEGCDDNPALKEAFRPHLEPLRSLAGEAQARGALGRDSVGSVAGEAIPYYQHLLEAFPEAADVRLIQQLEPLFVDTHGSAAESVSWQLASLWEKHPELVGPSAQMVLRDEPSSAGWRLLAKAGEAGWNPGREERDWMVNWLNGPADQDPTRLALWNSGHFEPGVTALATFTLRDPGFMDGLSMADRNGALKPVPDALVDHLLQAPGSEKLLTSNRHLSGPLFALIAPAPNPALENRLFEPLMDDLDGLERLSDLPAEKRTRLAVLGSLELSPEMRARLESRLESALLHDQEDLDPIVDAMREPRVEGYCRTFATAETVGERLEAARGSLALTVGRTRNAYAYREKLLDALDGLSPEADQELEQHLGHRLAVLAAQGKRLHEVDRGTQAEIELAALMARPSMLGSLRQLLPPDDVAVDVAHRIRFRLRDANDERLAEPGHSEQQRLTWLEDSYRLAKAYKPTEVPKTSLEAWAKHATGWASDACLALGPEPAYRAGRVLVQEEDPSSLLFEVQGRLKAGKLLDPTEVELAPEEVVRALDDYRALRDEGLGRSQALDRVLGKVELPAAPTSAGIRLGAGHVEVNGVRLRKRV